ncbi:hypothetical protein [Flaviaesturariibacter terrae]
MRKIALILLCALSASSAFALGTLVSGNSYRWRKDDGNETTASWFANENTPASITAAPGQNMRLRFNFSVQNSDPGSTGTPQSMTLPTDLQYLDPRNGTWTSVSSNASNDFVLTTSPNVASNTATTIQLSSAGLPNAGRIVDAGGPAMFTFQTVGGQINAYELEWILRPTASAQSATYSFRMSSAFPVGPVPEATLNLTIVSFNYAGSPFCGTSGSGTPTNSYPAGGTYSGDGGLVIDATTGAVDVAASSTGIHTATYTYGGGLTATAQVAIRPQVASSTGITSVGNQTACAGAATAAINFSSPIEGLSYSWNNLNPAVGLAASGSGNIPSFTAINNGNSTALAQVNVKAAGGTGCDFHLMAFRYTIYPIPAVNAVADQFYCRGVVTNPVTFSGPVSGTSYIWSTSSALSGMPMRKGTNLIPAFTTGSTVGSTTVTVTPSYNKCLGASTSFVIGINNCTAQAGGYGSVDARSALDLSLVAGPNPTTGTLRVQYSGTARQLDVLVRDQYGTILLPARRYSSENISVDMSSLRPGTYAVQFADPVSGVSIVRTIVKL